MGVAHLIRHAEPSVRGMLLGRTDVELGSCAISAASLPVANVFASPLRRALQTAELLFPKHAICIVDGFAERDLGDWDGLRWDEVKERWPELAGRAEVDWFGVLPPNGEAWDCFMRRVGSAWDLVRTVHAGRMPGGGAEAPPHIDIAIVAHVGVNAVLAQLIAGRDPVVFRQAYLEVLTLEFES